MPQADGNLVNLFSWSICEAFSTTWPLCEVSLVFLFPFIPSREIQVLRMHLRGVSSTPCACAISLVWYDEQLQGAAKPFLADAYNAKRPAAKQACHKPAKQMCEQVGGFLVGGTSLRGISGGERKRLAIALSLLSMPPPPSSDPRNGHPGDPAGTPPPPTVTTLLVDEPTSGAHNAALLHNEDSKICT
eukprot:149936-Pelagomonas_calceolata.AAC.7